jgi:hypothetical protein
VFFRQILLITHHQLVAVREPIGKGAFRFQILKFFGKIR